MLERGLPDAFLGVTKDALTGLVARYARTHGPFTANAVAERWGIGTASVETALEALVGVGKVTSGAFLPLSARGSARAAPTEYVDVEVLRSMGLGQA